MKIFILHLSHHIRYFKRVVLIVPFTMVISYTSDRLNAQIVFGTDEINQELKENEMIRCTAKRLKKRMLIG